MVFLKSDVFPAFVLPRAIAWRKELLVFLVEWTNGPKFLFFLIKMYKKKKKSFAIARNLKSGGGWTVNNFETTESWVYEVISKSMF